MRWFFHSKGVGLNQLGKGRGEVNTGKGYEINFAKRLSEGWSWHRKAFLIWGLNKMPYFLRNWTLVLSYWKVVIINWLQYWVGRFAWRGSTNDLERACSFIHITKTFTFFTRLYVQAWPWYTLVRRTKCLLDNISPHRVLRMKYRRKKCLTVGPIVAD